ncbi:MAG: hypothetical protein ABJQ90_12165 [Parasphingorhabdus sp.]
MRDHLEHIDSFTFTFHEIEKRNEKEKKQKNKEDKSREKKRQEKKIKKQTVVPPPQGMWQTLAKNELEKKEKEEKHHYSS